MCLGVGLEYACFLEIQALWACDMSNLSECMCMCGVTRVSVRPSRFPALTVSACVRVRVGVSETQTESVFKFRDVDRVRVFCVNSVARW